MTDQEHFSLPSGVPSPSDLGLVRGGARCRPSDGPGSTSLSHPGDALTVARRGRGRGCARSDPRGRRSFSGERAAPPAVSEPRNERAGSFRAPDENRKSVHRPAAVWRPTRPATGRPSGGSSAAYDFVVVGMTFGGPTNGHEVIPTSRPGGRRPTETRRSGRGQHHQRHHQLRRAMDGFPGVPDDRVAPRAGSAARNGARWAMPSRHPASSRAVPRPGAHRRSGRRFRPAGRGRQRAEAVRVVDQRLTRRLQRRVPGRRGEAERRHSASSTADFAGCVQPSRNAVATTARPTRRASRSARTGSGRWPSTQAAVTRSNAPSANRQGRGVGRHPRRRSG